MDIRNHVSIVLATVLGLITTAHADPAQRRFEPASLEIPAGDSCILHPSGRSEPSQSIPVGVDEDRVARFMAVRPNSRGSIEELTIECVDANDNHYRYAVDLRSEKTFASRPFDASRTSLTTRPALAGDPMGYTQEELIQKGYGLRPDPQRNPSGYARWLATTRIVAAKLRSAPGRTAARPEGAAPINAGVSDEPSDGWTGPVVDGSYHLATTAAETQSYLYNEATWNVPVVTPGGYGTGVTAMTVWNGLDNVFQAILDVLTTSTTATFGIHRQNFHPWSHGGDTAGTRFTPAANDMIFAEEWYCDAKGKLNLAGGYACTYMMDQTQGTVWECDQANSSDCPSYTLDPTDLGNGKLGFQAEWIIEDDTAERVKGSQEWPDFGSVTMKGSAWVAQGNGTSGNGYGVSAETDPNVMLLTDANASSPLVRGDGHLVITLPTGGVTWSETQTNVYYWDGSNFDSYSPACGSAIGVGPNSRGLTNGTPWITGCNSNASGNHSIYQMQTDEAWVKMQTDVAQQIAVSPQGNAWAVAANGDILYWNGSNFVANPTGGCATSIGVGPNSRGLTNGTPWIMGCSSDAAGNHDVFQMQTGGAWVKLQSNVGTRIAVSPNNVAWAVAANGGILYWNGSAFVANPTGGCATSIGVGPNSRGLTNGTPWITGCGIDSAGNRDIFQMQTGGAWVKMQERVGTQIAVSATGDAWVLSSLTPDP